MRARDMRETKNSRAPYRLISQLATRVPQQTTGVGKSLADHRNWEVPSVFSGKLIAREKLTP